MRMNHRPAEFAAACLAILFGVVTLHAVRGYQREPATDSPTFQNITAIPTSGKFAPSAGSTAHIEHTESGRAEILDPFSANLSFGLMSFPLNPAASAGLAAVRSAAEFAAGSSTCGLQEAHDKLPSSGGTIRVPPSSCVATERIFITKSGVHIVGSGQTSSIRYNGTSAPITGMIEVGVSPKGVASPVSDFSIEDVSLDGGSLTTALLVARCTNCSVLRVRASNGWQGSGIGAPIGVLLSEDVIVRDCTVSGGRGPHGDGIYFGGVTRPQAVNNAVSDVTRIGIVTEAAGSTKSSAALVEGNSISYAHDSSGGQQNAGIWLENTNGGRVESNKAWNMSNNSSNVARGIVIGAGSSVESDFILQDNDIGGANIGYYLPSDNKINIQIIGGSVHSGQNNAGATVNYSVGVAIAGPKSAVIRNVHFGPTTYNSGGGGTFVIDMTDAKTPMDSLLVEDCEIGNMSHVHDSGDINVYSLAGAPLTSLTLRSLHHWKIKEAHFPKNLVVTDCTLTFDATKYSAIAATSTVNVTRSEIICLAGGNAFGTQNNATVYSFDTVTFDSFKIAWQGGTAPQVFKVTDCIFKGGSSIQISSGTGGSEWSFNSSRFEDFDAVNGAIKTSFTDTVQNRMSLEIRNCEFRGAANSIPIRKAKYDPTQSVLVGNQYTSMYLCDFRDGVTQVNNVRVTH